MKTEILIQYTQILSMLMILLLGSLLTNLQIETIVRSQPTCGPQTQRNVDRPWVLKLKKKFPIQRGKCRFYLSISLSRSTFVDMNGAMIIFKSSCAFLRKRLWPEYPGARKTNRDKAARAPGALCGKSSEVQ